MPSAESRAAAFPGFAADAGIEGLARLRCVATALGVLENCTVSAEAPDGLGFGDAALSLSDEFRAEPSVRSGVPARARVSFAVHFGLAPVEPGLPWTGPPPDPEAMSAARRVVDRLGLSLVNGPNAIRLAGLATDRIESVRQMTATVERETSADLREAHALNLARTQSIGALRMLAQGQRRPARPNISDEAIGRAQDQLISVTQRQSDQLKALYCARYDCGGSD